MPEPTEDPDGPAPRERSGWGGCALWVVAFLVVTIGGCGVGLALRGNPHEASKAVSVEAGDGWIMQVYKDETKASCAKLVDNKGVLLTEQCAYSTQTDPKHPDAAPTYQATSIEVAGAVVVFGPVPPDVASVRLTLADGSHPVVRTGSKDGVSYFVNASPAADRGPTTLLDAKGDPVSPPV